MSEAVVTTAKPRSNGRTLFAGVLTLLLLVAFVAAFVTLGGNGFVSGLLKSFSLWNQGRSTPVAVGTRGTVSTTASLPPGVDDVLAKRVYVEQIESQVNIGKLVNGDVTSFDYGKVTKEASSATIEIKAHFKDGTSGPGVVGMALKGKNWFFAYIAGRNSVDATGLASTVARGTNEQSAEHLAETARAKVDPGVLNTLMSEQVKSQAMLAEMVAGEYTRLTVDKTSKGLDTATIDVTLTPKSGASTKGQLICIRKEIDGKETWFITTFKKV
jgi:hypothetical protein